MLDTISFRIPNTIIEMGGSRSIVKLIKELELKATKILILTDEGVVKAGLTDNIKSSLGEGGYKFDVFDGCKPNAPSSIVEKYSRAAKEGDYDLLIGVGGGSTMDTTKVVSVMAPNDMAVQDLINCKKADKFIPIILVPTTAGTGSEWDDGAVITDESIGQKKWIINENFLPKGAVIDPELTLNLPQKITAETGMDVLSHAIEGYITPHANIITDMFAEAAIKLVSGNLRLAYARDSQATEARYNMSIAAALGIKACTMAGPSLTHQLDPELVMKAHISHGAACVIILPHDMQFELIAAPERLARVAELMGEKVDGFSVMEAAQKAVEAVKRLAKDLGMAQTLSEIGVTEADIPKFVDNCIKYRGELIRVFSRRKVSREDLMQVYRAAL